MGKSRSDYLLGEEAACDQLDIFFDWYDIDFEEIIERLEADEKDAAAPLKSVRQNLIKDIRRGIVVIENSQQGDESTILIKQTLKHSINSIKEIQYREITGKTQIAVRPGKGVSDEARMYDFLGVLCGHGADFFCGLRGGDIRTTRALGYLFLIV